MTGFRQARLVAARELRERSRSWGFRVGMVVMLVVVVAAIVVPAVVEDGPVTRDVGIAGHVPEALEGVVVDQGAATGITVHLHRFDDATAGEQAVRSQDVDVLIVDSRQLLWRDDPDAQLQTLVTGAIQLVTFHERAEAAGLEADELVALVEPVAVENVELGIAAGRSPDDEWAAYVMSLLLLGAVATYGQLVLTGVVQEKSSRVVEVLLARMPARSLLAGKVAGIGLLGFAQFAFTALAAFIATLLVDAVDLPAISPDVLVWVVVWFVLGYALYAMAYGAVGSLVSRTEDASGVSAPITTVLIVGYWASLMAVGRDPEAGLARLVSLFPPSAPFAMPGRIALGATAWWEPFCAAALTLVAIAGLVMLAARVYSGAILHIGSNVKLSDAWRRSKGPGGAPASSDREATQMPSAPAPTDRLTSVILIGVAVATGVLAFAIGRDALIAVAVGAAVYAIASRLVRGHRHAHH